MDLDQIIDRAGIGNYQLHRLKSEIFKSSSFLLKVFEGVVLIDAVGF